MFIVAYGRQFPNFIYLLLFLIWTNSIFQMTGKLLQYVKDVCSTRDPDQNLWITYQLIYQGWRWKGMKVREIGKSLCSVFFLFLFLEALTSIQSKGWHDTHWLCKNYWSALKFHFPLLFQNCSLSIYLSLTHTKTFPQPKNYHNILSFHGAMQFPNTNIPCWKFGRDFPISTIENGPDLLNILIIGTWVFPIHRTTCLYWIIRTPGDWSDGANFGFLWATGFPRIPDHPLDIGQTSNNRSHTRNSLGLEIQVEIHIRMGNNRWWECCCCYI